MTSLFLPDFKRLRVIYFTPSAMAGFLPSSQMGDRTTSTNPPVGGSDSQLERRWCVFGAKASHIEQIMETTYFVESHPVNQTETVAVRQTVTGLEQGVAAIGEWLTAGPWVSLAA